MTNEQHRPSTADIAERDAAHERGGETADRGLDEDLQQRARPSDERDESAPLLGDEVTDDFRGRWEQIQGEFVDEPRAAVQEADALVAELMQQLADSFADERSRLENQWDRGDEVSTEELRVALQRYRSFFDRLLST